MINLCDAAYMVAGWHNFHLKQMLITRLGQKTLTRPLYNNFAWTRPAKLFLCVCWITNLNKKSYQQIHKNIVWYKRSWKWKKSATQNGMVHFKILMCEEMIFPVPRGKIIDWGTKSAFFFPGGISACIFFNKSIKKSSNIKENNI